MSVRIITEGKTKLVEQISASTVRLIAKNDITAGDGKKHDIIEGKAAIATETTVNIFELLERYGLPIAYLRKDSLTSFIAPKCRMLPFEVVVRGEAHGSYLKRFPSIKRGQQFSEPRVELYLKTAGRTWKGYDLPCDDPLMKLRSDRAIRLYDPSKPIDHAFLELPDTDVFEEDADKGRMPEMCTLAYVVFNKLRDAWRSLGYELVDMKVEFGIDEHGALLIADVIDNDSWRLVRDGAYVDKQVYRDGGSIEEVYKNYLLVAELTKQFALFPL